MADKLGEDVLAKTGKDLFQELLRFYPVADPEDYVKAGAWRNDLIRMDLQIVMTHRGEAGASDPIPLDEVKMPPLPYMVSDLQSAAIGASGSFTPKPFGTPILNPMGAGFKELALFVGKWKLDPVKTKAKLGTLTEQQKSYVMDKFKAPATETESFTALEEFVFECEKTDAWKDYVPEAKPVPKPLSALNIVRPVTLGNSVRPAGMPGTTPSLLRPAGLQGALLSAQAQRPAGVLGGTPPRPSGLQAALQAGKSPAGALANAVAAKRPSSGTTVLSSLLAEAAAKRPKLGGAGALRPVGPGGANPFASVMRPGSPMVVRPKL